MNLSRHTLLKRRQFSGKDVAPGRRFESAQVGKQLTGDV